MVNKNRAEALNALDGFLQAAFSTDDLRRLIRRCGVEDIERGVNWHQANRSVVDDVVVKLEQHQLLDRRFFVELEDARPNRILEIRHLAKLFTSEDHSNIPSDPSPTPSPAPASPRHLATAPSIGGPQHLAAARSIHMAIVMMMGIVASGCIGGGIFAIAANANAKSEFNILGATLNTGHVGVAFVGIGLVVLLFTIRALLNNIRELAAIPENGR